MKRFIVEFGTGADLHGGNVTEAAQRAVKDAMSHCCLCGISEIVEIGDLREVRLEVKIGCPHPEKLDRNEVLKQLSFYEDISIEVVQGGMEVKGLHVPAMGEGDKIVIAVAAITVFIR